MNLPVDPHLQQFIARDVSKQTQPAASASTLNNVYKAKASLPTPIKPTTIKPVASEPLTAARSPVTQEHNISEAIEANPAVRPERVESPTKVAPAVEDVNSSMQEMLNKWLGNIDEQYKLRTDSITQGTLSQLRGAANAAAQAGQSFGGSFAGAQRQAILGGQELQNQAYADMLAAQNQVHAQGADYAYEEAVRRDSRQYQEDQAAGALDAELRAEAISLGLDLGHNPFENAAGTMLPYDALSPDAKRLVGDMAVDSGMSPSEFYGTLDVNDYDVDSATAQRQQAAEADEFIQRALQMSNDMDDLLALEGSGNYEQIFKEIENVLKSGVDPDDLVRYTFVDPTSVAKVQSGDF